jgi:hypothetical protein
MPAIILTDAAALRIQREDTRLTADTLHRACISVLTSLLRKTSGTASGQYESILRAHCVQVLVSSTATPAGAHNSDFQRKFALLGALAGACNIASVENSTSSVFGDIIPFLLSTMERGLLECSAAPSAGITLRSGFLFFPL